MKKTLLFVILLMLSIGASAQNKANDFVRLKDGSIIEGRITRYETGDILQITATDGTVFRLDLDDIDYFRKGASPAQKKSSHNSYIQTIGQRGYFGIVEAGVGIGTGWLRATSWPSFSVINGYQFNDYLLVGLGVGLRLSNFDEIDNMIPIFAHGRVNFSTRKVTPFVAQEIGYAINGGLHLETALGIAYRLDSKNSVTFSVASNQEEYIQYVAHHGYTSRLAHSLTLKLGFTF